MPNPNTQGKSVHATPCMNPGTQAFFLAKNSIKWCGKEVPFITSVHARAARPHAAALGAVHNQLQSLAPAENTTHSVAAKNLTKGSTAAHKPPGHKPNPTQTACHAEHLHVSHQAIIRPTATMTPLYNTYRRR